jgi:hypothetical protein
MRPPSSCVRLLPVPLAPPTLRQHAFRTGHTWPTDSRVRQMHLNTALKYAVDQSCMLSRLCFSFSACLGLCVCCRLQFASSCSAQERSSRNAPLLCSLFASPLCLASPARVACPGLSSPPGSLQRIRPSAQPSCSLSLSLSRARALHRATSTNTRTKHQHTKQIERTAWISSAHTTHGTGADSSCRIKSDAR